MSRGMRELNRRAANICFKKPEGYRGAEYKGDIWIVPAILAGRKADQMYSLAMMEFHNSRQWAAFLLNILSKNFDSYEPEHVSKHLVKLLETQK